MQSSCACEIWPLGGVLYSKFIYKFRASSLSQCSAMVSDVPFSNHIVLSSNFSI